MKPTSTDQQPHSIRRFDRFDPRARTTIPKPPRPAGWPPAQQPAGPWKSPTSLGFCSSLLAALNPTRIRTRASSLLPRPRPRILTAPQRRPPKSALPSPDNASPTHIRTHHNINSWTLCLPLLAFVFCEALLPATGLRCPLLSQRTARQHDAMWKQPRGPKPFPCHPLEARRRFSLRPPPPPFSNEPPDAPLRPLVLPNPIDPKPLALAF
jgi:hypothetical protein